MSILSFIADLPNRLARVTSGGRMIKEVDGLRFLAIFPVVIQHLSERYLRNAPVDFIKGSEYEFVTFIASRGFIGVYIFIQICCSNNGSFFITANNINTNTCFF